MHALEGVVLKFQQEMRHVDFGYLVVGAKRNGVSFTEPVLWMSMVALSRRPSIRGGLVSPDQTIGCCTLLNW